MCLFFGNNNFPVDNVYVDMIEYNHVYNTKGDHCFTQVIFWLEHPVAGIGTEFRAAEWSMVEWHNKNIVAPIKQGKLYSAKKACYHKGQTFYVNVYAPIYKESWTVEDPERVSSAKHYGPGKDHLRPGIFFMEFSTEYKKWKEEDD